MFDCWEMNGVGYAAGSVQTVIGSGANPAFASDEITITAKWKNDDSKTLKCVISVPALIDIPYKQEFTSVPWSVDSLELGAYGTVWITFHNGIFQSQKGDMFPYLIKDVSEPDEVSSYKYSVRRPEEHTIQVCIPNETWEGAAPGEYTATLCFDIKGVY